VQGAGTYSAKDATPASSIIVLQGLGARYPPFLLIIFQGNNGDEIALPEIRVKPCC